MAGESTAAWRQFLEDLDVRGLSRNAVPSSELGGLIAMPFGAFDAWGWWRSAASCSQQPGQSGEVVGGHSQDEARADALDTAIHGLCHAADGFGPAEGFFDLLSVLLGQGVARMPGGSAIDC